MTNGDLFWWLPRYPGGIDAISGQNMGREGSRHGLLACPSAKSRGLGFVLAFEGRACVLLLGST